MSEHSHDNKPGELEESRLVVDNDFEVAPVNDRLFGSFVEHLGRCVYDGIVFRQVGVSCLVMYFFRV